MASLWVHWESWNYKYVMFIHFYYFSSCQYVISSDAQILFYDLINKLVCFHFG